MQVPLKDPYISNYIGTESRIVDIENNNGKTWAGTGIKKGKTVWVKVKISNDQRLLKPGMFVRVQIEFEQHENVTVVPMAALVKRNGKQGVFEVDRSEKKAHFVPVELGIVNGTRAEILNPPLSDAVVTLGQHLLEDGSNIILPDETPQEPAPRNSGPTGSQQRQKPATGAKP